MTTNSSDVTAGTNATATQYNNMRKDVLTSRKSVVTATDGATVTFNLDSGSIQQVTLGGDRTLALSNDNNGQSFVVILRQDGTGGRTVNWWSNIKWAAGTAPTLSTDASAVDIFGFIRIGSTEYLGTVVSQQLS